MTLQAAQAEYLAGHYAAVRSSLESVSKTEGAALRALCCIRQVLSDCPRDVTLAPSDLRSALREPLEHPRLEADRHFVLGWLHWLAGKPDQAEPPLEQALNQFAPDRDRQAEAAYWLARVRLLLHRPEAVDDFEQRLRSFGGSAQASYWFVDLLWRAGRLERAEQVWRAVRGSPRMTTCDEAPLLDARMALRRGDTVQAGRILRVAAPRGGVARVERFLLLAWTKADQHQLEAAETWLRRAERGPYPSAALRAWRRLIDLQGGSALGEPPAGVKLVPWRLHQAARASAEGDPGRALACTQSALALDPMLSEAAEKAALVRSALPELKLLARARVLAAVVQFHPEQPALSPGLLIDALRCLEAEPEGPALLDAAQDGDLFTARQLLAALAGRDDLPPALAHHLALFYHRAAIDLDERAGTDPADPYWRLAWHGWLSWAAAQADRGSLVIDWLLGIHRCQINTLLARSAVDQARRHWRIIRGLPEQTRDERVTQLLSNKIEAFREQLATEHLVATREAMRYGIIADGWNADYEKGLGYLSRLLSLDRDNVRLLTALVEICTEWFLDCYNNQDFPRLWQGVERYTPFAAQLARLVDQAGGVELSARAALSEFYNYRAFTTADPEHKAALYREALRFDLSNEVESDP
jgi:tetratricopeptide (TPR) repeat protein